MARGDRQPNRYARLLVEIFRRHHTPKGEGFTFARAELTETAERLGIVLPKNLGDIIYSFRYRAELPAEIAGTTPAGMMWTIYPAGRGLYRFALAQEADLTPNRLLEAVKVPECTPSIVLKYARVIGKDEQNLLARLRYNRMIDLFMGATCYSLQNHLRTTVTGMGQVETDELYIGVDQNGVQYVFPVQAKGGSDRLSVVQIAQDIALCGEKFPDLVCRAIGAQFMAADTIALFAFRDTEDGPRMVVERHYRLVDPETISPDDLRAYQQRPPDGA